MITYITTLLKSKIKNERGATAVEYGAIVATIGVAIVAAAALLAPKITAAFNTVITAMGG